MASQFPFIKLISAENMVGFNESAKIQYLHKVFSDSYKSPLSVIVIDGIERILGEWAQCRASGRRADPSGSLKNTFLSVLDFPTEYCKHCSFYCPSDHPK